MNNETENSSEAGFLLNSFIEHWAQVQPKKIAMVQHEDGREISYKRLATLIDIFALRLLDMGLKKGDCLATQLVLIPEHVIFMYACFKIGVIIAPLDLRLKADEIVRDVNKIEPRAFFFLGKTPVNDFRGIGRAVQAHCPSVKHLVQFSPKPEAGDVISGAISIQALLRPTKLIALKAANYFSRRLEKAYAQITPRTPALIIYTTGTTGEPKPALLCHENILVQNRILSRGMGDFAQGDNSQFITMINLPPSHVGCVTETLMTTFYIGGKAILLKVFDVEATLAAIQDHRISLLGQIPTQFRMLWGHPDYEKYDLSSLKFVIYAGSAGDLPFLKRLSRMAPNFGTGLGMTENAGFATFSTPGISPEAMVGQVGKPFPDLAEVTIRQPMKADGSAGAECDPGEQGEICYHPPIVFLGYYKQPEVTRKTVSTEGILYTGDLGYFKTVGDDQALFLAGRKKFVIKQKGYNVFPGEVEEHIAGLEGIAQVEVVGAKHQLFDEGIFAFVKLPDETNLSIDDINSHCKDIASYKRPQHIEIWPKNEDFPLTRSTKVDKLELSEIADEKVVQLRLQGLWDAKIRDQ